MPSGLSHLSSVIWDLAYTDVCKILRRIITPLTYQNRISALLADLGSYLPVCFLPPSPSAENRHRIAYLTGR